MTETAGSRTAEQIARSPLGPRPVPPLAAAVTGRTPRSAELTLDSGLRVLAVRKPGAPLAELRLRIPFGAATAHRRAAAAHSARAELLAETLMLGTEKQTRQQVDAELASVGGHLTVSVDPQRLMVSGSVLSTGLPVVLGVLADTLAGASFRTSDVGIERARLHEHLLIAASQPSTVARQRLQHRRFGDHPAAWDMPSADDLRVVTAPKVRQLAAAQVVPNGATLVLVGDLSPAKTLELVARSLGEWRSDRAAIPLGTPPPIVAAPLAVFHHPGAVQSQVRLSAPAVGREDPSYPAQQLANLVYGGYFSSRLVENIREDKGYTYGASSTTQFWPGRAAITVSFDTNTASTAPAVWEALYELGRIALLPPTPAEVDSARNYALGTLAASLATQAGYASMMSNLAAQGLDAKWLADYRSQVAAVTVDEVQALARTIFAPSAFMGVVVGDVDVIGSPLSSIAAIELL